MKGIIFFKAPVFLCVLMCLVISGCVKSNTPTGTATNNSISSIIANSNNVTLLDSAMIKTGLDSLFNVYGPFTYFATTDQQFIAAGLTNTVFDNLSNGSLRQIILYGAVAQVFTASQFPAGPDAPLLTQSGDSIFITNNSSGICVNGTPLATENVVASNGIMHVVGKALLPPVGNLLQTVQADTAFSYFAAAVARASTGSTNISSMLSGGNVYTIFLPDNGAFQNAGYATIDDINNANPDSLSSVLEYHIIPQRAFTSDFVSGKMVPTLLTGKSITLTMLSGAVYGVQGSGNSGKIVIYNSNIVARSGVIHVIGQLLLP